MMAKPKNLPTEIPTNPSLEGLSLHSWEAKLRLTRAPPPPNTIVSPNKIGRVWIGYKNHYRLVGGFNTFQT